MTDFQQAGVDDWRILGTDACAWFDAPSLTAGAALISRIAEQAGTLPALNLRPTGVRVRISEPDAALAGRISAAASDLGLTPNPAALQSLRLTIDAAEQSSVKTFWQTALAYESSADTLEDPQRREPSITFHPQDLPRPLRNRIHVDIGRPSGAVDAIRATLGQDPYGAYGLTLADADGNEADVVPGGQLTEGPETADWQTLFGAMVFYPTASPQQASALATAVATLADEAGLPILIDLSPTGVTIDTGKDQWEVDDAADPRFVALATQIQTAAHALALTADPTNLRFVQLAIDAADIPAVQAFWKTVLGYEHDPRPYLSDIYDPHRLNPVIMFQPLDPTDERRHQPNRINFTLDIPEDQLEPHITAAESTGGKLQQKSKNSCTLTDPEANKLTLRWH